MSLGEYVGVTKYEPRGKDHQLKGPTASFDINNQIRSGQREMFPFDGTFRSSYPYQPTKAEGPQAIGAPAKQIAAADCTGLCELDDNGVPCGRKDEHAE